MASPNSTWSVVSQRPTTGQNSHGQYVQGQEVRIRTGMGHEGTVFIPYAEYSADKAQPALASLAARLDAVGSLSNKG